MVIIILPFSVSLAACGQLNPPRGRRKGPPSTESLPEGYSFRHFLNNPT